MTAHPFFSNTPESAMPRLQAPLSRHRGHHRFGRRLAVCALALCALAMGNAEAARVKYSSYIKEGTVFRDANRNGEADDPIQTTTGEDGSFEIGKGKGRLYLMGGTDIRTGKANTILLTAPNSTRAIGTLSSLWQALLDRSKKNKTIRIMLNVPAKVSLADYTAAPIAGGGDKPKPKAKAQALIKRDSQNETLVQFLKALAKKAHPSVKAHRAQAAGADYHEDDEIAAIAESLIANGSQPTDLSDLGTARATLENAAGRLPTIAPPSAEVLDLLAAGMTSLNKSIDQLDSNSPPADQLAIEDRLLHQIDALANAVNSNDYSTFQQIALPPPVITGITVDSGSSHSDHITSDDTPTLFGTVDRTATAVRVYSVNATSGARSKLADVSLTPEANGSWSYTSAQLNDGSYRFAVSGLVQSATEVETAVSEITVTIDSAAPSDSSLSVTPQTTNLRTPVISGNWDGAPGNHLTVTVNGTVYTADNGLDLSQGAAWRLLIPQSHQIPNGVYDVQASVSDAAGNVLTDSTTGELTVEALSANSTFAVGAVPRSLAFATLNSDALPDIVVANQNANSVSVLLANGNGGFQTAVERSVGSAPVAVAGGDMDGDGDSDVVAANFAGGTVSVLLNDGSGNLTQPTPTGYPAGSKPAALVLGHFNGDNRIDAAVADAGSDSLIILINNGSGGFNAPVSIPAGAMPYAVATADLDGDKANDIVIANRNGNSISAFLGNGNGSFQAKLDHAVGTGPAALALGDLNADGKPDLAVANGCCSVGVALGKGDGHFDATVFHAVGNYPYAVAIANLDGSPSADLATANWGSDSVSILVGDGTGEFPSALAYGAGSHPVALAVGDINGDGQTDLGVANYSAGTVSLLPMPAPAAQPQ